MDEEYHILLISITFLSMIVCGLVGGGAVVEGTAIKALCWFSVAAIGAIIFIALEW